MSAATSILDLLGQAGGRLGRSAARAGGDFARGPFGDAIERMVTPGRQGGRAPVTLLDMTRGYRSLPDAASMRGIESDIDPRAILGAGAVSMAPAGYATGEALKAWGPWEAQFGREANFHRDADLRMQAMRLAIDGYRSNEIADPDLAAELAAIEQGERR